MTETISIAPGTDRPASSIGRATVSSSRRTPGHNAQLKSHFASLDGNPIHYATAGEGKHSIVFVHCWAGNSGFWRDQVPALAEKARLVLVDLPGHGQSGSQCKSCTMDYFADAVLAVMQDAGVDKATLIGHSMGGPVIYRVYEKTPEKVAALAVMDAFLRRPQLPPGQAEQLVAPLRTPIYQEFTRQFFGAMFPIPGTEALRDRVLSEMVATPQPVMLDAMIAMFGPDQPDWSLKRTTIPVLAINSKGNMWDADSENYIGSISPRTAYQAMEGVGHWLMLERPAEFNAILIRMLRKFDLISE